MVFHSENPNFLKRYLTKSSIGAYISSTIGLVEVGRYTKVVEGLVDDILDNTE